MYIPKLLTSDNFVFRLCRKLGQYSLEKTASVMITFALSLPVLIGSVGFALDMSEAHLVRQRLSAALDASALAGAAMSTDEDEIRSKVEEFFAVNYPDEKIGTTFDLDVSVDGDDLTVSANASFNTNFMWVFGIRQFTVSSQTVVAREVRGLEVVLVLDITGSMSTNNNIAALREAATNFVDILFERTDDPESIKIGLVPYATSVNIGPYGIGLTPDGDVFEEIEIHEATVDEPETQEDMTGRIWVSDIDGVELDPDKYTTDANASSSTYANWNGCVIEYNEYGWNANASDNDPYPNDTIDHEGPFPIYAYETYGSNSTYCGTTRVCTTDRRGRTTCSNVANSCYYPNSRPNTNCPRSMVVPLTSDQDELNTAISGLSAYGNTMGNIGMVWGYRLISPEFPFTQGASWGDTKWRKVIVMMTDGENTMDNNYSAFWRTRNHNLTTNDQNERFAEVCDTLKDEKGVLIYTITFEGGVDDATKAYYEACATTPSQYYDAPSQEELVNVFENISRELANLHIRS